MAPFGSPSCMATASRSIVNSLEGHRLIPLALVFAIAFIRFEKFRENILPEVSQIGPHIYSKVIVLSLVSLRALGNLMFSNGRSPIPLVLRLILIDPNPLIHFYNSMTHHINPTCSTQLLSTKNTLHTSNYLEKWLRKKFRKRNFWCKVK
ncbi:hypothetical protein NC653_037779 [Populus alba x Populus x berolinensis]|uniref:Uncharacterized protein n=1 Tax=Populus alba x Populus x berolinensis TaxID=444605 RepID=A0AAD6LF22_9ROSI|nr:hypothetical protein NC653_037779 [Populus alba x Populus x berolinensis]